MLASKDNNDEFAGTTASLLAERITQSCWDTLERYRNLLTNGAAKSIIAMSSKGLLMERSLILKICLKKFK